MIDEVPEVTEKVTEKITESDQADRESVIDKTQHEKSSPVKNHSDETPRSKKQQRPLSERMHERLKEIKEQDSDIYPLF